MLLNDNTIYNSFTQSNLATGGNIGASAASTVDITNYFTVNQTTANQSITLFTPTDVSLGQVFYIHNIGTVPFTMYNMIIGAGRVGILVFNGTGYTLTTSTDNFVNVIVFNGESNSGGLVPNASATAPELAVRRLNILNNTSLVFEPLQVGVNNLIDHATLTPNITHGWEIGLANNYDNNLFTNETYLIKTGQGSSTMAQWTDTSGVYFTKFKQRIDAAKAFFKSIGKIPVFYVWYSQGINDSNANTNADVWAEATKLHFNNIRRELGFCPIIMTQLMSPYTLYNTKIAEIVDEYPFTYSVVTSDLTLLDPTHWSYSGMKIIADRMANIMVNTVGENNKYTLTQNYVLSTNTTELLVLPVNGEWVQLQIATNSGLGTLSLNGGTPSGGTYSVPINCLNYFEVECVMPVLSLTEGAVIYFDTDTAAEYDWNNNTQFLCGFFNFSSQLNSVLTSNPNFAVRSALVAGDRVKMRKSGDNIILSRFTGSTYTDVHTFTNILLGLSTLYLKTMFALSGTRQVQVTVNTKRASNSVVENIFSPTNINIFEDFITTSNPALYATTNSGAGASTLSLNNINNGGFGVTQLSTGTSAAGRSVIHSPLNLIFLDNTPLEFECLFSITTLNDATNQQFITIGFGDSITNSSHLDGAFILIPNTVGAAIIARVVNNGTAASITTSIVPAANTNYKINIVATSSAVIFRINSVIVATIPSTLVANSFPITGARSFGYLMGIFKTIGTGALTLNIDYFSLKKKLAR